MISEEQKARLFQERDELHERAVKLRGFFDNSAFDALDAEIQFLLEAQYDAMVLYERALVRRMTLLGLFEDAIS
ncbi:MAG: hypothetical protein MZV65_38970 [Chromatiales bacterium]|nr:hypothetical protein [Chromatiales bacterium]